MKAFISAISLQLSLFTSKWGNPAARRIWWYRRRRERLFSRGEVNNTDRITMWVSNHLYKSSTACVKHSPHVFTQTPFITSGTVSPYFCSSLVSESWYIIFLWFWIQSKYYEDVRDWIIVFIFIAFFHVQVKRKFFHNVAKFESANTMV